MNTVAFEKFREGDNVLVDLETVPVHQQVDFDTRNKNLLAGIALCDRCDGTGNEYFSMYHQCPDCKGTGRAK